MAMRSARGAGWVWVIAILGLVACKGKGDGGPGGGGPGGGGPGGGGPGGGGPGGGSSRERSAYFLTSSALAPTGARLHGALAQTTANEAKPCMVAGVNGLCVTPTRARGMVVNLSLGQAPSDPAPGGGPPSSSGPNDYRPYRLFGSGEGLDREGKIEFAPFDLAAPKAIPGAGNLQDARPGTKFGSLDTLFGYLDVQVPLGGKFWTLRYAFYPQPLADDLAVKMCVDAHRLENIAKNAAVVPGAPAFARGDVMYCEKATQAEECGPNDFRWLDLGGNQFVAARPAQPRRLEHIVNDGVVCKLHPEGPTDANHHQPGELALNGFRMTSRLTTTLSLWARYQTCHTVFTTADATGKATDGTSLSATVNYELDGFVFIPGASNPGMDIEGQLRVATLRPIFAREKLGPGPASGGFADATVTIALGNEPLPSCGATDSWDGGKAPEAGAPGPGGQGGQMGGPGDPSDGGMAMTGPGPSDAAGGIHPATTKPPGCVPSDDVVLTTPGGAACAHTACPAPEWTPVMYTPWSYKSQQGANGKDCRSYCVSQTCPAGSGVPQLITCTPACE